MRSGRGWAGGVAIRGMMLADLEVARIGRIAFRGVQRWLSHYLALVLNNSGEHLANSLNKDGEPLQAVTESIPVSHTDHHQRAPSTAPITNIVSYVPKAGKEAELLELVKRHEPALRKVGLVTQDPFRLWKAYDIRKQRVLYIEQFVWKDGDASTVAHQTPEIMAVWEPMSAVLEELTICEAEPI